MSKKSHNLSHQFSGQRIATIPVAQNGKERRGNKLLNLRTAITGIHGISSPTAAKKMILSIHKAIKDSKSLNSEDKAGLYPLLQIAATRKKLGHYVPSQE